MKKETLGDKPYGIGALHDLQHEDLDEPEIFGFFYGLLWALKWTAILGALLAAGLAWVLP